MAAFSSARVTRAGSHVCVRSRLWQPPVGRSSTWLPTSSAGCSLRQFQSSSSTPTPAEEAPRRCYLYHADVHAQLFLASVSPKNLTSCFKDPQFLDFFYRNLRPNPYTLGLQDGDATEDPGAPAVAMAQSLASSKDSNVEEEMDYEAWDGPLLAPSKAAEEAHKLGFHWLSPCQGEQNFLSSAPGGTAVVFRELTDLGELTWGGSYKFPFQPRALRFDAQSGYVYHPSPPRPQSRTAADRAKRSSSSSGQASKASDAASPYGAYSLLCSNLVLSRLSDGLDLDITGEPQSSKSNKDAPGGSIEYQGKRYPIRLLRPQDAGPWSALRPSTRP